ncbi:MAG: YitT family protein [Clostridiales bacterium]|nr:YitT family protein [Clostridiales bacterium]
MIKLDKAKKKHLLKQCALVIIGCVIYSFGIAVFLDPYHMAAGGVTGISIIINDAIGGKIGTGWLILIINVPLFIIGLIFIGKTFVLTSLVVVGLSSGLMELWEYTVVPYIPKVNIIVASIVGGALFGIGLGLVFRTGSSTGGTDIIVKLIRKKFRYVKTGIISMVIDLVIVTAGALFVYKDLELMLITIGSIVIFSVMFNRALYGGNSAMMVFIITTKERAELICNGLLKQLDVGATIIDGQGAYSGAEKTIIMCAIKNYVYPRLRDVVKEYDSGAFTIVSSAMEIYGEGYKPQDAAEL